MSYTYHLACRTCRVYLWVGQGWPSVPPSRNIYTSEAHLKDLRNFLYAHETTSGSPGDVVDAHELSFCSRESGLSEDFRETGHDAVERAAMERAESAKGTE